MNERHLIDANVFNIRFSSPQQAQAEQDNGLTDFIKDRLLHIVDHVFTRLCPPQTAVCIDTLELDLGTVAADGWRDEMAQRLERGLTKALREKIASLPKKGGSGLEQLLTPPQRRLNQLRCFLEHGCLPAALSADQDDALERRLCAALDDDSGAFLNLLASLRNPALAVRRLRRQFSAESVGRISRAAAVSHPELARLFAEEGADSDKWSSLLLLALYENRLEPLRQHWPELLQRQSKLLRRELFRHGQTAEVRRRIAWEFPDRIFADLIRLLEPTETAFIEEIVFRPAVPEEAVVQPGESEDSRSKRLREFTLAYLLTERGSRFNKKAYIASLISRMAAHDNVDAAVLAQSLQETLAALRSRSKAQQEMLALLAELRADSGKSSARQRDEAAANAVQPEEAGRAQFFSGLLRQAFYAGLPEELLQSWQELLRQHGTLLRQELFRHGQAAEVRRRIAWEFPGSIFADLIRLLEPVETAFIEEIIFRPVLPVHTSASEESGSKRLREFTLACLLTERGSRFNKKEYLAALISRMAAHDNVDAAVLAQSLQETLAALRSKSKVQQEMLALLREIQTEKPAFQPQRHAAEPASLEQLLALLAERDVRGELLEAVRRHAAKAGDLRRYCQLVAACLREDRPVDFEEILRRCETKPPPFPAAASLEQLLALLAERDVRGELLEAVRRHAAKAGDLRRYCQLVAACLREDRPVNFEEIIGRCQQQAEAEQPPAALHGFRLSAAEQRAVFLLLLQEVLTAAECAELALLLENMLAAAPARLRWLFEAGLPESSTLAERMEQAADTPLLARLFCLLRPAEHAARWAQADLLAAACAAAPFGMSSAAAQQLQRQFISRWLFARRLDFSGQDFVTAFAEFLRRSLSRSDRVRFFVQLRAALAQRGGSGKQQRQAALKQLQKELLRLRNDGAEARAIAAAAARNSAAPPPDDVDEETAVENAGLVLAAVYLPRLFAMLGLLEKSAFRSPEAAERAAHLLQYLVEQRTDRPEYQLTLNKMLCGLPTGMPLIREIEASEEERRTIDGLLAALIQHWGALGSTSVSGLREAFLRRPGRLCRREEAWHLHVQAKPYDMLLDRLPWSIAVIRLPWMRRVLHVKWR